MLHGEALVDGLLNYPKPSELAVIQIPEVERLKDVPQDKRHHPEGDAWIHTMQVVDRAANLRDQVVREDRLIYMLSAWLHDIGKWDKTFYRGENKRRLTHWTKNRPKNTRIVSYGHEQHGSTLAAKILERELPVSYHSSIPYVEIVVANHMKPLLMQASKLKAFKKMKRNNLPLFLLGMINWADKGEKPDYWFRRIEELNES